MSAHAVDLADVVAFVRERCAVGSRFDRDKVADAILREFTAPPKPVVENDRPIVRVQSPLRSFRERGKFIQARLDAAAPSYGIGTLVFVIDAQGDRVLGEVRSCQLREHPRPHRAIQVRPRWDTATC